MEFSVYTLPSLISAILLIGLGGYTLYFKMNARGAKIFSALMLCGGLWALNYSLSLSSVEFATKVFWMNLAQIGPDFSSPLWILMVKAYTGQPTWLNRKQCCALFILPVITTILMWTNDFHHLLRRAVFPVKIAEGVNYVGISRGPWFWVEVAYAYLLFASALFILLRFARRQQEAKNAKVNTLILSLLIPLFSNFLDIINLNPLKPYGATSIFFSLSGLVLVWGLFRQRLFDLAPIASEKVVESMVDGVVVIDEEGFIVDFNQSAQALIWPDEIREHILGRNSEKEFLKWVKYPQQYEARHFSGSPVLLPEVENRHNQYFTISISALFEQNGRYIGQVTIFHDITSLHETNERLQSQLDENKALQAQLAEQAMRDPLTGCFNRRVLSDTLPIELARARREGYPISIVMLDIDHFKTINDTYGHAAGDQTLQVLGNILRTAFREGDHVYRMGGEEFLVILPGVEAATAALRLNHLRETVENIQLPFEGLSVHITLSIGISVYPNNGATLDDLINKADKALYKAKDAGRNRVFCFEESQIRI
jgi:diguanylate cyclase (GGDEF)-like protein/PAS domain S-box-containing protein